MSDYEIYAEKNDGTWEEATRADEITITQAPVTPEALIESITTRKVLIDAIKADIDRQRKRKEEHEWYLEQEKAELVRLLKNKGLRKMETGRGKVSLIRSKSLLVRDMDKLESEYPEYFKTVSQTKFDRKAMKDDMLKNGVESDYAYIEEKESVRIG